LLFLPKWSIRLLSLMRVSEWFAASSGRRVSCVRNDFALSWERLFLYRRSGSDLAAICEAARNSSSRSEARLLAHLLDLGSPDLRAPKGVDVSRFLRCARREDLSLAVCVRYVAPINRPDFGRISAKRQTSIFIAASGRTGCCCVSLLEHFAASPSRGDSVERQRAMNSSRSDVHRMFNPVLSFSTRRWCPTRKWHYALAFISVEVNRLRAFLMVYRLECSVWAGTH